MDQPAPIAAGSALAELLEVSPQVDAALILERDGGRIVASTPTGNERMADQFGATCTKIVAAAERARTDLGREPVTQVEVATPDGHVFVVTDSTWVVAAVTDADPTVGLVFYDLKTALRAVRESDAAGGVTSPNAAGDEAAAATSASASASIVSPRPTPDLDDASRTNSPGDEAASEPQGDGRWRRRKS